MDVSKMAHRDAGPGRLALVAFLSVLIGSLIALGPSGCAKTPAQSSTTTVENPGPDSMHGTGGRYLIDPNAQTRWSYAGLPSPAPSGKPNYLLKSFLFEPGASTLNSEARGALGDLVEMLQTRPAVRVLCLGLCDGNKEKVNATNLGMNRASAARQFLLDRGVKKDRIEMATFGSSMAQAPPEETIGQRLDRKVEVWLLSE